MGEGGLKRMDNFGSFSGFQGTNYGRKLGVLFQYIPLDLGGSRMWDKDQNIIGEKRERGI